MTPSIWENDVAEELAKYIDWHREHPHTITPRKAKYGPDGEIMGGQYFHEDDSSLVYSHNGSKPLPPMPLYAPSRIGVDCDLDEVSTIAMRTEYSEQLLYNAVHDDPWYSMSVKDQLEQTHIDGSHTTRRTKEKYTPEFDPNTAWQRDAYADYAGGGVALNKTAAHVLDALSLRDKALIHGQKTKVSPWTSDHQFTRFTSKGTALDEYKKIELEDKVSAALEAYAADLQQLADAAKEARRSAKRSGKSTKRAKSSKVVPEDDYDLLKARIGGAKAIDALSVQLTDLSNKVSKHAKTQRNEFNYSLDLLEACEKLRVVKVNAALALSEDPNVRTSDDEPLFLHCFARALKIDSMSGQCKIGNETQDSGDRKKLQKILEIFVKFAVPVNADDGKDQLTALHMAVIADNVKMLHWIIQHGGDVSQVTRGDKLTPVMLGAKYGHVHAIGELLKQGAVLNEVNELGMSALHSAAAFGQTRAALFLLRIGIDKKLRDCEGRTAAEVAFDGGYLATAQAISAFASPQRLVAAQLEYIVEQEKKKAAPRSRRKGVALAGNSAAFLAFANNALSVFHHVGRIANTVVRFVKKKCNFKHSGDQLEEEEEEELMLDQVDDTAKRIDARDLEGVRELVAQSPQRASTADDVMDF